LSDHSWWCCSPPSRVLFQSHPQWISHQSAWWILTAGGISSYFLSFTSRGSRVPTCAHIHSWAVSSPRGTPPSQLACSARLSNSSWWPSFSPTSRDLFHPHPQWTVNSCNLMKLYPLCIYMLVKQVSCAYGCEWITYVSFVIIQ
jgi:hypothetical protein